MNLKLIILLLSFFALPTTSYAQKDQPSNPLIEQFVAAVKVKDKTAATAAFQNLKKNPGAVQHMKEKMPDAYTMFKAWGLIIRTEKLKKGHSEPFVLPAGEAETKLGNIRRHTNRDTVIERPNQERMSNTKIVDVHPNHDRLSNRDSVRQSPNQDRSDNREKIKARRR